MIYFKSLLADLAGLPSINQRPTAGTPSPGGEGRDEGELNLRERSERHFLCCSGVSELSPCGRQSALIKVGRTVCPALQPCPSGTFENSQQHARVIYGWVHRPFKACLVSRGSTWCNQLRPIPTYYGAPLPLGIVGLHALACPNKTRASRRESSPLRRSSWVKPLSRGVKPGQAQSSSSAEKKIVYFLPRRSLAKAGWA